MLPSQDRLCWLDQVVQESAEDAVGPSLAPAVPLRTWLQPTNPRGMLRGSSHSQPHFAGRKTETQRRKATGPASTTSVGGFESQRERRFRG